MKPGLRFALGSALALALAGSPVRAAGVDCALSPALAFVAPGGEFDLDLVVPAAGTPFNGFQAVIGYDPAALTFVQAVPVGAQQGCLMTGSCSAACGTTFHLFQSADDSLTVYDGLLCDQTLLAGPGQLYRLHFHASSTDQVTHVTTRAAHFYAGGVLLPAGTTASSRIVIGSPAGVGPSGPGDARTRISAEPNPARGAVSLAIRTARDGVQDVDVLDLSGRRVRRLASAWRPAGVRALVWDGADERGARAAAGVYLVRVRVGGESAVTRVTVIRG